MRFATKFGILSLFLVGLSSAWAVPSLESELKQLETKDEVPSSRLVERLYSVQGRATPLRLRTELGGAWAQNFGGSGFVDSSQWTLDAQFHITDRWALAAAYSYVSNKFTSSAKSLEETSGILPDVDYVKQRYEGRILFNVFYGKFRFSRSQSLSFDQYLGLGVAQNELRSGTSTGPLGEFGFAFWFGQHISARLGVKDYYFRENRVLTQGNSHNVHGYLQTGYLF